MNRTSRARLLVIAAVASLSGSAGRLHAQDLSKSPRQVGTPISATVRDSAKARLLHDLLTRTAAVELGLQSMEAMVAAQRSSNPSVPPVFWDRFLATARARRQDLEALILEVYDRHFTSAEVGQLLEFYSTPFGQKLLSVQPAIARESLEAGQVWGQKLGEDVAAELLSKGVIKP
jgi:uncharacterized protein